MNQRAGHRYMITRGLAFLLAAVLASGSGGCSEGQQEVFPSVVATQEKTQPSDPDIHTGRSLSWPDPEGQEIVLSVAAPFSQESLNRIRLLYLYKLDIVRAGQTANTDMNSTDRLFQESLIHQLDYDLERLDRFLADYDRENFILEQIPVLLDTGATRQQQESWLSEANHPNIIYSADASLYYQQNRLSDLESLVSQDARFHSGTVHGNALQPFYQDGSLYGLPFLMTYPIIIGSADLWESESTRSPERWDVWLDQLSLSFEEKEPEPVDPTSEAPSDDLDPIDYPLPFSLAQPWLTYMQLAFMDQTTIDQWIVDAIAPESIRPSQELIESWQRLLNRGFTVEGDGDLPGENLPALPDSTFDPGLHSYQDNRDLIQSLAEDGAIMAWLDDSSQTSYWQSRNQGWQAVGVPVLQRSTSYDSSALLTVRGWFVDNQSIDPQVQIFAQALSAFLSIDPDCYLILALETSDSLTGYLPSIKDDRVWQRYRSDRNQADLTTRQWQDLISQAIFSDDLLQEGWSEQLHRSLQDEIAAWGIPEDTGNRTE